MYPENIYAIFKLDRFYHNIIYKQGRTIKTLPHSFFSRLSNLTLALSFLLAACSGGLRTAPPAVQVEEPRALVIIASDDPSSADPAENWAFGGGAYLPQLYDSLFRFVGDKSPELEPLLAAEIPSIENGGITRFGLVYTIKLKPKVHFHDGSPLNADAVVYSYDRLKALKLGVNGITADWISITEKVDDLTVRFTLKQPFSDFLNSMGSMWGNYIVNPRVAKAHEKEAEWGHAWLLEHDAGSGPYTLVSFDHPNEQIFLARYKDYWGGWSGNPNPVEKVTIRWLSDTSTGRALLERGEADILVNPPAADFASLEKTPGFTGKKYPSIMQYYLGMNGSTPPLDDPRVRQALHFSFDTETIINTIFNGNMIKMNAAVGPGYPDVYPARIQPVFDLEKARALLKDAGYSSGLKLTINLLHIWPSDTAVANYWQTDLAKIGVKLNIQEMDSSAWSKIWFDDCTAGTDSTTGAISTMSIGGDYPSAWEVLAQIYPTPRLGGGKCSAVYIKNPLLNDMMNNLANTTDPRMRRTLFQGLYDTISEDDGAIWIGQAVDLVVLRDTVQGYEYSFSLGGNYIPLAKLSLKK